MAPQRASLVRHASVRSRCLILLKTSSIGIRSGAQFRRGLAIVIGAVDFALAFVRHVVGVTVEAHPRFGAIQQHATRIISPKIFSASCFLENSN